MELEIDSELEFDLKIKNMSRQERIDAAMEDLANGKCQYLRQAAKKYGIPKSTLSDRKNGKHTDMIGKKTMDILHFKNQWISCEGRCGKWFCSTCVIFQSRYDFNLNVNVFECKCMKLSVL